MSRYYFRPLLENGPGLAMRALVHVIWNKFRIGSREITEPFLRVSSEWNLMKGHYFLSRIHEMHNKTNPGVLMMPLSSAVIPFRRVF